jgi:hypothetical protein
MGMFAEISYGQPEMNREDAVGALDLARLEAIKDAGAQTR